MAGIYIHIPFCKQACHYCDFHFSTNLSGQSEMVDMFRTEIELQRSFLSGEGIDTIYFGGGTPSLLSPTQLRSLLETLYRNHPISLKPEITLEANPDDLSMESLIEFRNAGINRLSIGVQSFQNETLTKLNRAHNAALARESIRNAYRAGFDNISIDLIYAIPWQNDENWKENVRETLQFAPQHISAYSLTVEEKTVFGRWAKQGKFRSVDDDHAATQLQLLVEMLALGGYEQYEVSNFCRPGFISIHNSNYWNDRKYLGIGPSAHSYNGVSRQHNASNNQFYIKSIRDKVIPATVEVLSREDKINEYLLTSLRTSWGVDLSRLRNEHGLDLEVDQEKYLSDLRANGLATIQEKRFILTMKGKLLADRIASDLFVLPE
ncbi:MAG: radical SAM family heme chaperone HemW [Chryseolinea sp.]